MYTSALTCVRVRARVCLGLDIACEHACWFCWALVGDTFEGNGELLGQLSLRVLSFAELRSDGCAG